ncbi:glycosyltransferase family 39 protein, partial [Solemya elarraichensis gill symbiont]
VRGNKGCRRSSVKGRLGCPVLHHEIKDTLVFDLDAQSIWRDEATTSVHSTFSAYELWTQQIVNKPPLFYLITSLFWSPGDGAFALRFPNAILGSLSVMLCWMLGKALAGRSVAFLLSLFVLLSDINITYSQEARQYILLSIGWLILLISLIRLIQSSETLEKPQRLDLLLTFIGVILMVHTHPIALHYLTVSGVAYFLALVAGRHKFDKRFIFHPVLISLIAGITILPWLFTGLNTTSFNWLKQDSAGIALLRFF